MTSSMKSKEVLIEMPLKSNETPKTVLLSAYDRILYRDVEQKVVALKQIAVEMHSIWSEEIKKYEQLISVKVKRTVQHVPCRNYYNSRGEIDDPTMFPYHTACYPLLDCYDCVYEDREFQPTYEKHAILPTRVPVASRREEPDDDEVETAVPQQLQTSWQAIHKALLYEGEDWDESDLANVTVGASQNDIVTMCNSGNLRLDNNPDLNTNERCVRAQYGDCDKHGPHNLPLCEKERKTILLKLLRHAMSDLQRDHRLANAVVRRMIDWCYFNDVTFYARFLTVIMAEQRKCDGECHVRFVNTARGDAEEPDHYCTDWQQFELLLAKIVPLGLAHFTEEHALLTCAAIKIAFDKANTAARSIEESLVWGEGNVAQNLSKDPKTCLKQSLYLWNNTNDNGDSDSEDDKAFISDPMPYALMMEFLFGLGRRAVQSRDHISTLASASSPKSSPDSDCIIQESEKRISTIRLLLDSFYNCVRTIVFCAEMSVRRLPSNQRSMEMGGVLVRCLVEAYLEPRVDALDDQEEYMPRWRKEELNEKTLIEFNRYSDMVNKVAEFTRIEGISLDLDFDNFVKYFLTDLVVPIDVRDAIRSLFSRDLVDIYTSLCGFGDAVVWLRLKIDPLDPLLFLHHRNYPSNYDDAEPYMLDENLIELSSSENVLAARYDYTLLLLQQAWNQRWTPERHNSFQTPFREAATNLLLSSHRIGMPLEIARSVVECLPRSWWPDPETKCWCQQCLIESSIQLMRSKLAYEAGGNGWTWTQPLVAIRCSGCYVASWVSNEHRKRDYQAHLCDCGKPPFNKFGIEEELLCRDVTRATAHDDDPATKVLFQSDVVVHTTPVVSVGVQEFHDEGDADDDGSWESVEDWDDKASPEKKSATDLIFAFFNERYYKLRSRG